MNALLVLGLATLVAAAPQGYNYQNGQAANFGPASFPAQAPAPAQNNFASFTSNGQGAVTSVANSFGLPNFASNGNAGAAPVASSNLVQNFASNGNAAAANSNGALNFASNGQNSAAPGASATGLTSFASHGNAAAAPAAPGDPAQAAHAAHVAHASHASHAAHAAPAPETFVTKHFFLHTGPEEEDDAQDAQALAGPVRKHYRVLFIKAPSGGNTAALLRAAAPQNEEKTVIYVLKQKTDVSELKQALDATEKPPSKPEVFFIKYKTPEEALHAQHEIQAQYDALGGTSEVSDEGIAPVTSVVGSVDQAATTNGQYLPPAQ